jgi:hypothetical protein
MVRIRPTTAGDTDYLNLNEIQLFDASGTQLPTSSLTVFMSNYYQFSGSPGGQQHLTGVTWETQPPVAWRTTSTATTHPTCYPPPAGLCIDGDLSTTCSSDDRDANLSIHICGLPLPRGQHVLVHGG